MLRDRLEPLGIDRFITIGDHLTAWKAAIWAGNSYGLEMQSSTIHGEAQDWIQNLLTEGSSEHCYLATGEPTVTIYGTGQGGRCQHMALTAAIEIAGQENIAVLCGSTDGTDGPTTYSGGLVDGTTLSRSTRDPHADLANNDSLTYLKSADALIETGPTGSNVNDIVIVVRTE